jgi:UDP-glucose:(heptosyl)LPS alpha-1,3-glucosyltransferase
LPPKSKRIVLLKPQAKNQGGLEKTASRIAQGFIDRGHEVTWLKAEGIKTSLFPSIRLEQFDRFTRNYLEKNQVDIAFGFDRTRRQTHLRAGNGVHAAYLESRIAPEGKLKYYSCLLNPLHRKILSIEKEAFESPFLQKLFTNSRMVKKQILDRFQVDPNKIQVIHNGVEWHEMQEDFDLWPEKKLLHAKNLQLHPKQFHFLFVGHGFQRKGLDLVLKALSLLTPKEVHLTVVGHDKKLEMYRAKAKALGIAATFVGPQANIRPFYQIADALVIPSFYDPFANVTVEALAMGLYVVSSKQNGGHEILTPETGHVIEDLLSIETVVESLQAALRRPKTIFSSGLQRQSVEHLDFSKQIGTLIEACDG